jgi:hypothetical protein
MLGTSLETVHIPGKLTVVNDALVNGLTVGKGGGSLDNNTAMGYYSLVNNTFSYNNTAIGSYALFTQQTSGTTDASGNYFYNGDNTAIGVYALYWTNGISGGGPNTMSGAWNTAVGLNALLYNTTGNYNTAIGLQAGCYFNNSEVNGGGPMTADKCTFLGAESRSSYTNPKQSTAIGYNSVITADNQIVLGTNTETVHIPGDLRAKKRIYIGNDNPGGGTGDTAYLEYVAYEGGTEKTVLRIVVENDPTDNINLNPTGNVGINTDNPQYKLDVQGTLRVTGTCTALSYDAASDYRIKENVLNLAGDSSFIVDNLRPITYKNILSGKQDMGFIAHELQEHYPFLVSGEKDGAENQSVNYIGLIALLVKEIQELKQDIKILKTKL